MSELSAFARGRLGADPKSYTTSAGKPMARASIAIQSGEITTWLSILTFGGNAEFLARHRKGDIIGAAGRLEIGEYTDREGLTRPSLTLIAEQILSGRNPRGAATRKSKARTAPEHAGAAEPFDDDMPF